MLILVLRKPIFQYITVMAWIGMTAGLAYPQIYKWIESDESSHYADQPHNLKTDPSEGGELIQSAPKQPEISPAEHYGFKEMEEGEKENKRKERKEANKGESPGKKAVVIVGDLQISPSLSGNAMIKATVKNEFEYAVAGLRLDVILFHANRSRAADLAIPFKGGKKRPDLLEAGEKGTFEYETDLTTDEIVGHRYRVVWNYKELVKPPAEGEKAPEGVEHKILNRKTGQIRSPGEEAAAAPKPQEKK